MNPDNLQSPNPSPTTPPVSPPSPPTNMQAPLNPISQSPQPKKSRKLGWILLIIVLLAAAIGGYLFYKHTHKTKIVTQTATKHDIALIKIGLGDGPVNSFYPADANTSGVTITNGQIFEGLVGWQNGTKVVPMLATSWTNPDDSSWVFTLRTNVKFHTGRTMTANDVKYSLEKLKDLAYGGGSGLGDTIKSVTVISPDKVKITTNGPDPILLNRLTFLYIVDSQSKLKDDSNNGTGPYVVKTGTDPVKDKVTDLVAFDNYWGGHIYTKELKISTLTDASGAITKLQSHQLDIFEQFTSLTEVKTLNADGINTIKEESSTVDMVVLNTLKKGSPLSNLKFRQAINIGIDRSAILKASDIEGTPLGQFVVKEIPGYDSSISVPEYNVIKAKQLIKDSGVKNPTLVLSYTLDASNNKAVKEIQTELKAIGVNVVLQSNSDVGVLADNFFAGKTDMFMLGYSADLFDASDPFTTLFQNPPTYNSPVVDKLLTQANQTIDGAKHIQLLQSAAQQLSMDVPAIPLFSRTGFYAQSSTGYSLHRDIPGTALGAYFWKVYQ